MLFWALFHKREGFHPSLLRVAPNPSGRAAPSMRGNPDWGKVLHTFKFPTVPAVLADWLILQQLIPVTAFLITVPAAMLVGFIVSLAAGVALVGVVIGLFALANLDAVF